MYGYRSYRADQGEGKGGNPIAILVTAVIPYLQHSALCTKHIPLCKAYMKGYCFEQDVAVRAVAYRERRSAVDDVGTLAWVGLGVVWS